METGSVRRLASGWVLAGVAGLSLAATFTVFSMIWAWEQERWHTEFQAKTSAYQALLRSRVNGYLGELKALRRFYEGSDEVDRTSFRIFVEPVLAAYPEIQAVEWIPRVEAPLRAVHEEKTRQDGFPDYSIRERSAAGTMLVAAARAEYFPVHYVEPLAGNEPAVGFDLGSHPARLAALERARSANRLTATAPIRLVQEAEEQTGFLVFLPVYRSGSSSAPSTDAKRGELKGFVLGVYRIGATFEAAISGIEDNSLSVRLLDEGAPTAQRLLHTHPSRLSPDPLGGETHARQAVGGPSLDHTAAVEVAGRRWTMVFTPTPAYLAAQHEWRAGLALAVGLLLTALLVTILYATRRRAESIAALVDERTSQLLASETRQRAILDTMVEGLITIDEHGRIETFNGAAERIFGYSPDEVRGKNVNVLMPEPDRHQHDGYLENYKSTGEKRIIGIGREVQGRRKNGSVFPMDLAVSETRVAGKRVFTGVVRDVSERKQAEAKLSKRSREAAILHRGTAIAAETQSFDEALDGCLELVCKAARWPVGHAYVVSATGVEELVPTAIWYLQDERRHLSFRKATERTTFRRGVGLPGRVWSCGAPVWISDVQRDTNFPRAALCEDLRLRSAFGFPILIAGQTVAVLEIFTSECVPPDQEFLKVLQTLGEQMGRVFERRRAAEAIAEAEERSRLLLESAGEGVYGLDVEGKTTFVNPAVTRMLGYAAEELVGQPMHALVHHSYPDGSPYPRELCPVYAAFSDGSAHTVTDEVLWRKDGTNIPIEYTSTPIHKDGKLVGAVVTFRDITQRKQAEDALRLAQTKLVEANRKLEAMSLVDSLTDIANRRHFDQRLQEELNAARRTGAALSLIICDIDHFKTYNDSYGHLAGDTCIKEVATCIRKALTRATDFPTRYGGEEFAVVLPSTDLTGAMIVAERIRQAVWERRLQHENSDVAKRVTVSLGVATLRPGQDTEIAMLVGRADDALYRAKKDGRNRAARETPGSAQEECRQSRPNRTLRSA